MNERQNVTLSIPKDVLRKAKVEAVRRNTSLSGLLTQLVTDAVERQDEYEIAMQRQLSWLRKGLDLGNNGRITWTREELHER
jgi:hypothetical protein